ncbi:glutamate cyclase domain-containing protein [Acinetobacter sp.]|uniref:glutamate cyclase domain-containing protein n=1 Tax=Acinetobacter sp. TaxID=472 RepID=UPI0035B31147
MTDNLNQLVGDRIDQLMTVEIRPLSGGLPAGYVKPLYDVCRNFHQQPLSMMAAEALINTIKEKDVVFIVTGAGVAPNLPLGETDGPPGAIALAATLMKATKCNVVIVTEELHLPPIQACIDVIKNDVEPYGQITVETYATGLEKGIIFTDILLKKYSPKAIVFVERDGPNAEGYFHGVRGDFRSPDIVGHAYLLADSASELNILTIGIGDGGNEVGFGKMRDAVTKVHPFQGISKGGFESGLITVTKTDITVAASVSNWGAYAVCAAIAYLLKLPSLLHDAETEKRTIKACAAVGGRDGANSLQQPSVDGIDLDGHAAFIQLLNSLVEISR